MTLRIDRVILAVTKMKSMVAFYNAVFDARLVAIEMMPGIEFYRGKLAGIDLLMCPNDVAGVVAQQNRHQFRFVVENVEQMLATVVQAGGSQLNAIQEVGADRVASAYDPDGNTFELVQYS